MVSASSSAPEDRLWKALAEPARRRILDELRAGPLRTGDLTSALEAPFGISRFMVMKHLKVLVDAQLVVVVAAGRERWNHLHAKPIQAIHRRWIEPFAAAAADRMLRFESILEGPDSNALTQDSGVSDASAKGVPDASAPDVSASPSPRTPMTDQPSPASFRSFEVVVETLLTSPPERVWHALTAEIGSWWPRDYYVDADGGTFRLEAKVGGLMFEDHGEGEGTVWATVTAVRKAKSLRLSAEVWPEYGGPGRSIHAYTLTPEAGGTRLRFCDTMWGSVTESTQKSMQGGWEYLFQKAFRDWVENGETPPAQSEIS